jgi:WD40 repeat protein
MRIRIALILLALVVPVVGCSADATPSPLPSAIHLAPTPTVDISSMTPAATETTALEPLVSGLSVGFESWSPDGQWFAYVLYEGKLDDAGRMPTHPLRWLHFYNPRTGEDCAYSKPIVVAADRLYSSVNPAIHFVDWLPSDEVIVYNETGDVQGVPCGSFAPLANDPTPPPIIDDSPFSPNGRYRVETEEVTRNEAAFRITYSTTLTEVATGRAVASATWVTFPGVGAPPSGEWIGTDRVLIWENVDPGPFLLFADGTMIKLVSDLFHLPAIVYHDPNDFRQYMAAAWQVEGTDNYHIALTISSAADTFHTTWLYHSETGDIETIPYLMWWLPTFSPDGRWMAFYEKHGSQDDHYLIGMLARPVDPMGAALVEISQDVGGMLFSPDWSAVAFVTTDAPVSVIEVHRVHTGEQIGSWTFGSYHTVPYAWSPDERYLVAVGYGPKQPDTGLFLIELP